MFWPLFSQNHRLPSAPAAMPSGCAFGVGIANSSKSPGGVIRPILFLPYSVNQRLPSEPVVIVLAPVPAGSGNSVMEPAVVMRPILLLWNSVNQSAPSGPIPIPFGALVAVGTGNSVIVPAAVMRPILL